MTKKTIHIPTPDELRDRQLNHKKLVSDIRKQHGNVMRVVQKKFGANAEPIFIDKGRT